MIKMYNIKNMYRVYILLLLCLSICFILHKMLYTLILLSVTYFRYTTHSICISSNSEGSKKPPDDGGLLPKHVGASILNKGVVQISALCWLFLLQAVKLFWNLWNGINFYNIHYIGLWIFLFLNYLSVLILKPCHIVYLCFKLYAAVPEDCQGQLQCLACTLKI
jgi:hypothetical protein